MGAERTGLGDPGGQRVRRHPAVLGLREYPLGKTWGFPVGAGEGRCGEQGTRSGGTPPTRGRLEIWWEGFFWGCQKLVPLL